MKHSGDKSPERTKEIVVFSILKDSSCSECSVELGKGSFLKMEGGKPLCLECADLDHLVYLPRGDTALTRRSRGRYERQGLLVESKALEEAEEECLGDEERRLAARERAAEFREQADKRYVAQFAGKILSAYPNCPRDEAQAIATHACLKYSGRVGRSAAAKQFDAEAIDLAVKAHVRHTHTGYDRLLGQGFERSEARSAVVARVRDVIDRWRSGTAPPACDP